MHKSSNFSTFSPTLIIFSLFLIAAILMGVEIISHCGLICIPLMTSGVEYLFMCLWAICIYLFLLWRNVIYKTFDHFSIVLLCCWVVRAFHKSLTLTPYWTWLADVSSIPWAVFSLCWAFFDTHKFLISMKHNLSIFSSVACVFGIIFKCLPIFSKAGEE